MMVGDEYACLLDATIAASWTALALSCKKMEHWDAFVKEAKERLVKQGFEPKTIENALEFTKEIRANLVIAKDNNSV